MELLVIVTIAIKSVSIVGQSLLGLYFVKTGIQYVKDYKESVSNEKG